MLRTKRLKHAQQLIAGGRLEKAISLFNRMVADDPSDAEVLAELGELHLRLGVVSKALSAFERAATELERRGDLAASLNMLHRIQANCQQSGSELATRFGHVAEWIRRLAAEGAAVVAEQAMDPGIPAAQDEPLAVDADGQRPAQQEDPPERISVDGGTPSQAGADGCDSLNPPVASGARLRELDLHRPAAIVSDGAAGSQPSASDSSFDLAVAPSQVSAITQLDSSLPSQVPSRTTRKPGQRRSSAASTLDADSAGATKQTDSGPRDTATTVVLAASWPPRAASSESLLLTRRSDSEAAIPACLQGVQHDPFSVEARLAASQVLLEQRDNEGAAEVLWEGAQLLAETQLRQQDVLELLKSLRKLRWCPEDARLEAAIRLELGGRSEAAAALGCLQRAFRAEPNQPLTLLMLAKTFDSLDEASKATAVLKEGVRLALEAESLPLGEPLIAALLRRSAHDHEVRELAAAMVRLRAQDATSDEVQARELDASLLTHIAPELDHEELLFIADGDVVVIDELDDAVELIDEPDVAVTARQGDDHVSAIETDIAAADDAVVDGPLTDAGVWPAVGGYEQWIDRGLQEPVVPVPPSSEMRGPLPSQPGN